MFIPKIFKKFRAVKKFLKPSSVKRLEIKPAMAPKPIMSITAKIKKIETMETKVKLFCFVK